MQLSLDTNTKEVKTWGGRFAFLFVFFTHEGVHSVARAQL